MEIKYTDTTQSSIYEDALTIRKIVFVEEQQVPIALEIDEDEDNCLHFVLYHEDKAVGTVRLLKKTEDTLKVQRMAVLKEARKLHFGKALMEKGEAVAKEQGYSNIILGAQNSAIGFYEKLGYTVYGDEFEDAGLLHHMMEKQLN